MLIYLLNISVLAKSSF